jgi:type 1 glutamine amidotransferase
MFVSIKTRWRACGTLLAILAVPSIGVAQPASFRMPEYPDSLPPPPIRTKAEVARLLGSANQKPAATPEAAVDSAQPLRVVLVAGPKDHGKGEHDYPAWQHVWSRLLAHHPQTQVDTAWEFPTAEQMEQADVVVFYQRGSWDQQRAAAIDALLARGKGAVYIHWAVDGRGQQEEMAKRIGLSAHGGQIRFRHGDLTLDFRPGNEHPIARNFEQVRWVDESYWLLTGDPQRIQLLGTSVEDGEPRPQFWTVEHGQGRVFVSIPGHYMWTFDDPTFRTLLLRGIAWAGHCDVDRFNQLVTLDARVE